MSSRNTPFCTMQIRPDNTGKPDLAVELTARGGGRLVFDRTLASSLLIALGTDRRADPEDVLPPVLTAPPGMQAGLFSRRGWIGDILLSGGQRLGSRLWLLARAKQTEKTRATAVDYANEALADIADYHNAPVTCQAGWQGASRLAILAAIGPVSVTWRVSL